MSTNTALRKQLEKTLAAMAKANGDVKPTLFADSARDFLTFKLGKSTLRQSTKTITEYQFRRNLIPAFGKYTTEELSVNGASIWNEWVAHCVPYDYRRTFITYQMEKPDAPGVFVAKFLDTSMQQIEKTYAKAQKHTMEGIAG